MKRSFLYLIVVLCLFIVPFASNAKDKKVTLTREGFAWFEGNDRGAKIFADELLLPSFGSFRACVALSNIVSQESAHGAIDVLFFFSDNQLRPTAAKVTKNETRHNDLGECLVRRIEESKFPGNPLSRREGFYTYHFMVVVGGADDPDINRPDEEPAFLGSSL